MDALIFLTKRTIINKFKKAIRSPKSLLFIVGILAYIIYMIIVMPYFFKTVSLDSQEGLLVIITLIVLFTLPTNILMYVKKKGIVFSEADVSLLFKCPINPKSILMYRTLGAVIISNITNYILILISINIFKLPISKAILILLYITLVQSAFNISLLLNVYANEKLQEKHIFFIKNIIYLFIIAIVSYGVYIFIFINRSLSFLETLALSEFTICIPLFGWILAPYHLIILGPSLINVIVSCLFIILVLILSISAYNIKSTGKFYEDAAKFSSEVAEKKRKAKSGEMNAKKHKRKASIKYKGNYAQAIFYRQMLEYKKNTFFIFGIKTLINIGIGILIMFLTNGPEFDEARMFGPLIMIAVIMYIQLLTTGYQTKWKKELDMVYTFLIPDNAFNKLFYATATEHIRSLFDGVILISITLIGIRFSIFYYFSLIIIYVLVGAIRVYSSIVSYSFLKNKLGKFALDILGLFVLSIIVTIGAGISLLTFILLGNGWIITAMIYGVLVTLILMYSAGKLFEKYEIID